MQPRFRHFRVVLLAGVAIALAFLLPPALAQTGPSITQQPASQTNSAFANVILSVGVSGTGPLTYQWQFNGTNLPNNVITTVAGGGTNYPGGGGAATSASLSSPNGVAVDASGNLFIADTGDNLVRKVDVNAIITTVAGTAMAGYAGDGGPATNARLNLPTGVAVDSSGNLFIAEGNNSRVREVDVHGIITTVAGNGTNGYSGDGGPATNASMSGPYGVVVDTSGNLFIADNSNLAIRKVDTNGIITTAAGGNGLFGDSGDGGAATNASLAFPYGVALDAFGNLFIADSGNNRIRKVDTNGIITTVAGNGATITNISDPHYGDGTYSGDGGPATNAALNFPASVSVDVPGNLFIADYRNNRVRKVDTNGIITTVAGNGATASNQSFTGTFSGDGGAAPNAGLNEPFGVAVDASGNLFIVDWGNNRIREVALGGIPTLILDNLAASTAGDYRVIITSPYGSVTSAVATLTVSDVPPIIMRQPQSRTVIPSDSVVFSVIATGVPPPSYQWQFNGIPLPGSTNASLMLKDVQFAQAGEYAVLVGNTAGSVTSSNAVLTLISWQPAESGVSGALNGIIFTGNSFIAVGAGGAIITSPNGLDWTAQNSGATNSLFAIAQGKTNLVAVGASGAILRSVDGTNWLRQSSPTTLDLRGVAFGPGGFVAVGTDTIISSIDGLAWAARNEPAGPVSTETDYYLTGIAYGSKGYVAVGGCEFYYTFGPQSEYGIIISPNGSKWTDESLAFNQSSKNAFGVFNGNNQYVIVGVESYGLPPGFNTSTNSCEFLTSATGTSWTESAQPLTSQACVTAGTFGNGTFVAVGQGGAILASSDAINWTNWPTAPTNLTAVAYGNGTFVAVGDDGGVLQFGASSPSGQNPVIAMSVPTVSGDNLLLGFTLSQTVGGTFTLLQARNITGPWTTNAGAVMTTNSQTGGFQFSIPAPNTVEFFQVRSP